MSQNPAGRESKAQRRERIERIVAGWCEPFGGPSILQPAEYALLRTAAELTLHRPRRHEDAVRYANTISRILAQCGLANKHERQPIEEPYEPPAKSAADIIGEHLDRLQREREEAQS